MWKRDKKIDLIRVSIRDILLASTGFCLALLIIYLIFGKRQFDKFETISKISTGSKPLAVTFSFIVFSHLYAVNCYLVLLKALKPCQYNNFFLTACLTYSYVGLLLLLTYVDVDNYGTAHDIIVGFAFVLSFLAVFSQTCFKICECNCVSLLFNYDFRIIVGLLVSSITFIINRDLVGFQYAYVFIIIIDKYFKVITKKTKHYKMSYEVLLDDESQLTEDIEQGAKLIIGDDC